jgi:hypothetical protein
MTSELLAMLSKDARWRRPIATKEEAMPAELIEELAGWLARRTWRSGSVDPVAENRYLRNDHAALSVVEGKLQVESCGEITRLSVSSRLDLDAFVAFVQTTETLSVEALGARFSHLDESACARLLKLLFQGGVLRESV